MCFMLLTGYSSLTYLVYPVWIYVARWVPTLYIQYGYMWQGGFLPCISSMDICGKVGSSTLVIVAVVEINYAFDMDI